ncbi:hypothetical protein S101106_00805 [Levilactobacillus brevis]|nr:hypothetical protein S101106_00805 [Levilactobacillus brevis]
MYLYVTDLEKALTPNRGGRLFVLLSVYYP